MEALKFTLEVKQIPVEIDGEAYVLQELNGRERDKYLNDITARVKIGPDGKPAGMKNFDGMQGNLLVASLRKKEGSELISVPFNTIQGWPAKMQSALFMEAQKLSGLDESQKKDDEELGNV